MFFPEIMEAEHLRNISSTLKTNELRSMRTRVAAAGRIGALARDVDSIALILCALVEKLVDDGVISQKDLLEKIDQIDVLDGRRDGRLSAKVARGAMGVKPPLPKKKRPIVPKTKSVPKIPKPKKR